MIYLTGNIIEVRFVSLARGVGLLVLREPADLDLARGPVHVLQALAHVEAALGVAHR